MAPVSSADPVLPHYEVAGPQEAPTLLLANSLGATLAMWQPQMRRLTARFRVIRFDTRGHGRSPVPPGPYLIDDLTADAVALLDRLGVRRTHLCGLSLGGMVAMRLAATAPDRVDRMVLCCTSARPGRPGTWAERAEAVRSGGTASIADTVLARWITPAYATRHPHRVADLRAMLAATPAAGYAACCHVLEHLDLRPALADVRAPTLVIAGADDLAIPPEHGAAIAAGIPGARLAVVRDAAHLANIEQPDQVTDLILDHLGADRRDGEGEA